MRPIHLAMQVLRFSNRSGTVSAGALAASLAMIMLAAGIIYNALIDIKADGSSGFKNTTQLSSPSPTRFPIKNVLLEDTTPHILPLADLKVEKPAAIDNQAEDDPNDSQQNEKIDDDEVKVSSSTNRKHFYVKVPVGRIRLEPSTDSIIKSRLYKGERVDVVIEDEDWVQIHTEDGRNGWAHRKLFSEGPPSPDDNKGTLIKAIRTHNLTGEGGQILIELNDYCLPQTAVITGDHPRVVCDFYGLRPATELKKHIEVNTGIIRSIRLGHHSGGRAKTRVVIDLLPDRNYVVDQRFLIEGNIYLLDIHL